MTPQVVSRYRHGLSKELHIVAEWHSRPIRHHSIDPHEEAFPHGLERAHAIALYDARPSLHIHEHPHGAQTQILELEHYAELSARYVVTLALLCRCASSWWVTKTSRRSSLV